MEKIFDLLKYPFSDIKKLLTLSIINFCWFLIVPVLLVQGYKVRIIRSTMEGENKLPSTEGIMDILKNGFFLTLAIGIYIIIPIALFCLFFLLFKINVLTTVILLFLFVLLIIAFFMIPMISLVYSTSGSLKLALNPKIIFEKIMINPVEYFKTYAIVFLVFLVFICLIPLFNIFSGLVMVYPSMFSARIFAKTFKNYI